MSRTYQPTSQNQIGSRVHSTEIQGLYYIAHEKKGDDRGFFSEIALISDLNEILPEPFVIKQINQARSQVNVCRGLHAENWRKLIFVSQGTAFSALADVRPSSPSYKKVETFVLGGDDNTLGGCLFIDRGIANSVCVVNGPVDYIYCVDELYRNRDLQGDAAISLFDPELNIDWPIPREAMILSNRDLNAVTLNDRVNVG